MGEFSRNWTKQLKGVQTEVVDGTVVITVPALWLQNCAEMAIFTNEPLTINNREKMLEYVAQQFSYGRDDSEFGRFIDEMMVAAASDGESWIESCEEDDGY